MRALITGAAFFGATIYAASHGWEYGVPVFIIGGIITAAAYCYEQSKAEFDGYDDSVG